MESGIYSIWIHKSDPSIIGSFGSDYTGLEKASNDVKSVFGFDKIVSFAEIPEENTNNPNVYGLYNGELIGDFYHVRIALYNQKYNHYNSPIKHDKDYFQSCLGGNLDKNQLFTPIIHIVEGEEDRKTFFDSYELNHRNAPRFRFITDSGIWNYFAEDNGHFNSIVKDIINNYESNYYGLLISQEFADLNARLTTESYIYTDSNDEPESLDNSDENDEQSSDNLGHGADVSPFLFHSESKLKRERIIDENSYRGGVYDVNNYHWRVLLVDDRIGESYLKPQELQVTKEAILKKRIDAMMGFGTCECVYLSDDENSQYSINSAFDCVDNDKANMVVLCVDTIEKAECALKNYKFDFIFLDYLLKKSNNAPRRYGYELLTDLDRAIGKNNGYLTPYSRYNNGEQFIVGPDHRYFFMFISAFTTAISERLRLFGWSRSEELWHIAEGACPTNTPELFCYNLEKMMVKRIKDSGIENLAPNNILKIIYEIYRPAKKGEASIRKRANESYQNVLSLLYHYNRILNDVQIPEAGKSVFSTRGSVLMTSYFQKYMNMGGLLEHLVHLVHLTAFGTVRQWPEMWEESLFFKVQFSDLFNSKDLEKGIEIVEGGIREIFPVKEALGKLYGNIEDYILELKKLN